MPKTDAPTLVTSSLDLSRWNHFLRLRIQSHEQGLDKLTLLGDTRVLGTSELGAAFRFAFYNTLARSIFTEQPELSDAYGAANLEHRFQWTAPVLISPHDPNTLYHGGEELFKTTDGGVHWQAISPDLTRNDKSKQKVSGGDIRSMTPARSITTQSLRSLNRRSPKG